MYWFSWHLPNSKWILILSYFIISLISIWFSLWMQIASPPAAEPWGPSEKRARRAAEEFTPRHTNRPVQITLCRTTRINDWMQISLPAKVVRSAGLNFEWFCFRYQVRSRSFSSIKYISMFIIIIDCKCVFYVKQWDTNSSAKETVEQDIRLTECSAEQSGAADSEFSAAKRDGRRASRSEARRATRFQTQQTRTATDTLL